jgi:hypothetical protein
MATFSRKINESNCDESDAFTSNEAVQTLLITTVYNDRFYDGRFLIISTILNQYFYVPLLLASLRMLGMANLLKLPNLNIYIFVWHCPVQAFISIIGYARKKSSISNTVNVPRQ